MFSLRIHPHALTLTHSLTSPPSTRRFPHHTTTPRHQTTHPHLPDFKYAKFNLMEWMHNLGRAFDCFLSLLVGRPNDPSFDRVSREACESLGVFPEVWTSTTVYLSQVTPLLTPLYTQRTITINAAGPYSHVVCFNGWRHRESFPNSVSTLATHVWYNT